MPSPLVIWFSTCCFLRLPSGCCSNTKLSEQYLSLARDLDVMEAKTPEDVYKMHLVEGRAPTGELSVAHASRQSCCAVLCCVDGNGGHGYKMHLVWRGGAPWWVSLSSVC